MSGILLLIGIIWIGSTCLPLVIKWFFCLLKETAILISYLLFTSNRYISLSLEGNYAFKILYIQWKFIYHPFFLVHDKIFSKPILILKRYHNPKKSLSPRRSSRTECFFKEMFSLQKSILERRYQQHQI